MKHILLLTVVLCHLLSSFACAENTLQLPKKIVVVALNGENMTRTKRLELPDGLNQVALRFESEFERGLDADLYQSEVVVAAFEASNQQLSMKIAPINNKSQLRAFNDNPQIKISDGTGKHLEVRTDILKKEGLVIFRDFQQELIKFNFSNSPAAVSSLAQLSPKIESAQIPTANTMPASTSTATQQNREMAEEMLLYWYQQADSATRERFKAWIMQQ